MFGAIAVRFGVNATMALLTVESPVTQAFALVVQVVVVVVLLALQRTPGRAAMLGA